MLHREHLNFVAGVLPLLNKGVRVCCSSLCCREDRLMLMWARPVSFPAPENHHPQEEWP